MTDRHTGTARRAGGPRGTQRDTAVVPRRREPENSPARGRGVQRETVAVTLDRPPRLRGVFQAGFITCCWNALVVFLPILVTVIVMWWAAGRPGSVGDIVRAAGAVWTAGHGVTVDIAGLPVGLPPLLLTAAVFWRLTKAGANTVRAIGGHGLPAVRASTLSVALNYTLIMTVTAVLVSEAPFTVPIWQAVLHTVVLSIVAGSLGALSGSGQGTQLWHNFPLWLRRGMRTGTLITLAILSVGALLVGIAIAARSDSVTSTLAAYPGGVLPVGILTLLYVPTAAVWGASYVIGPGFALGVGTSVTVIGVEIGPLPVFPLFAAVPDSALGSVGTILYGVPILVSSIYGVRLGLRGHDLGKGSLAMAAATSGITVGGFVAIAAYCASGPLGHGRLAEIGPNILLTAGVAATTAIVFTFVGAFCVRLFGGRRDADLATVEG